MAIVPVRTCKVSIADVDGVEHSVEVTALTLYEAVAAGLAAFRGDEWVGQMGTGPTTIRVTGQQPVVEHEVRVQDVRAWDKKKGGAPAAVALRGKIEKML